MKNVTFILLCIVAFSSLSVGVAPGSDSYSEVLNDLWLRGEKRAALQIAEKRLRQNSNDLASLLICLDFAVDYMQVDSILKLTPKIKGSMAGIDGLQFSKQKAILVANIQILEQMAPTISEETIRAETDKGNIKNKPLDSISFIRALELDKLVSPLQPEERASINRTLALPPVLKVVPENLNQGSGELLPGVHTAANPPAAKESALPFALSLTRVKTIVAWAFAACFAAALWVWRRAAR